MLQLSRARDDVAHEREQRKRLCQREGILTTPLSNSDKNRVRPLNLGWCFLPSKDASDTPFLGRLWTNLAAILVDV